MGPWGTALSGVKNDDEENSVVKGTSHTSGVHTTESTALLRTRTLLSPSFAANRQTTMWTHLSYDATVNKDYHLDEQEVTYVGSESSRDESIRLGRAAKTKQRAAYYPWAMLLLSAIIFLLALLSLRPSSSLSREPQGELPLSKLLLSDFVFAPEVVGGEESSSNITFAALARGMLPAWYDLTVSKLPIFTKEVLPSDVYKTRKIMLKTRDLVDVFSPVYPNASGISSVKKKKAYDMWESIRHYLNKGYMLVGDFQDLHNAHVRYSEEMLVHYRNRVLNWKEQFDAFRQSHDALAFLAAPTLDSYDHRKSSHLFWKEHIVLPSGKDPATASLQLLGRGQLERSLIYLKSAYPYGSVLNESVHEYYHNLRKELRSLTDEFDLFEWVMFPILPETYPSIRVLKSARKLLGDLNDDWTAYRIYVKHNLYHTEQERLTKRINDAWKSFKYWVKEVDFEGTLQFLADSMNSTLPSHDALSKSSIQKHFMSLNQFLQERKKRPTQHFVIGNEAGDADTIISAISLAYLESMARRDTAKKTPIVAIPKADLDTQRPEVSLLLKLADISHAVDKLIFVDDPMIQNDAFGAQVSLVDHNVLTETLSKKNWTVVEIVDHHQDKGEYLDTCSGTARNIAFSNGKALVASACTLVAERLKEIWEPLYPASLGTLLLGVILLDSVNLSPQVGKVTQRDRDAVQDLLQHTDWQALSKNSQKALHIQSGRPDTTAFFDALQDAKYDPSFWKSLSVRDALRLDYKDFSYTNGSPAFGVSTVLMPAQDFVTKRNLTAGIKEYMTQVGFDFLGIMFAFEDDRGNLCRQLALCGRDGFPMHDLVDFLLQSNDDQDSLQLKPLYGKKFDIDQEDLDIRFFTQRNVKPSRKQIGPILLQFFESTFDSGSSSSR